MEKQIYIITLDHDILIVRIPSPKKYTLEYVRDEVELQTNIIGPCQIYYYNGTVVQNLEIGSWTMESPLELIENNTLSVNRFLINYRSRLYPVYIENYQKKFMLCLKLAIEKKFTSLGIDCPFDSQTLKINGLEVPGNLPLSELSYNTKIDLDLNSFIPQRQAITTYDLSELDDEDKEDQTTLIARGNKFEAKIDARAPKWRKFTKGFSLQCYCRNRECEARNRTVIINLGFGIFTLDSIKNKILCPLCKDVCQELLSAGFYFAVWKYKGMIDNSYIDNEERTWNQYHTWRELFDNWSQLKFSVRLNAN